MRARRPQPATFFPVVVPIVGEPEVEGLLSDRLVVAGVDYMERYFVHRSFEWSVQFHHLLTDDPDPDPHDHPWDFVSFLLTGGYRDYSPAGVVEYRAPCVVSRVAETPHRLELLDGPMWTLVACGPVRRSWGYHTERGWIGWREYRGLFS